MLEAIGDTPVVQLDRLVPTTPGLPQPQVFAKLELCNPGGSMKDRPALAMIDAAIADGRLRPGMRVVESSSGNMGIGLAQACSMRGYRFTCVVDPRTQAANVKLMRAYGAEIERVEQPDEATGDFLTARLARVQQLLEAGRAAGEPVFWPNQYGNAANAHAHECGTARELHQTLAASGRQLDVLLVATSTTGTLAGCLDYLRRESPETRVVAVDAAGSVLFGGVAGQRRISGLGAGRVTDLSRRLQPDAVVRVSDLDCIVGARRLARREAVLAGGSAGGLVVALERLRPTLGQACNVAMIVADGGGRYLETVYDDDWVHEATGCSPHELEQRVEADVRPGDESPGHRPSTGSTREAQRETETMGRLTPAEAAA